MHEVGDITAILEIQEHSTLVIVEAPTLALWWLGTVQVVATCRPSGNAKSHTGIKSLPK